MISFGREVCSNLAESGSTEWLVTNGIGGYASGSISGQLRRRYHGLLIAALNPPLERKLLLSKLDESVEYDEKYYPLHTNHWVGGVGEPYGFQNIERFRLEGTTPVWTFSFADALLEKRIWLQHGQNTAYIRYDFLRGSLPLKFSGKLLINYREHDHNTHADNWQMDVQTIDKGLKVTAFEDATPFYLLSQDAELSARHVWYRNFYLSLEGRRGFDAMDDHLYGGKLEKVLEPGQSLTIVATAEPLTNLNLDGISAYEDRRAYEEELLYCGQQHFTSPSWMKQLMLSADQFIVRSKPIEGNEAYSIMAGYPWTGDRSQSFIMSLPGLALTTGRFKEADSMLRSFGSRLNNQDVESQHTSITSDDNQTPESKLYYIEALRAYLETTGDKSLIAELFSTTENILQSCMDNNQNHVQMDPRDNLLSIEKTNEGDKRVGKPVDLNALWFNAVLSVAKFASELGEPAATYLELAEKIKQGFKRFWQKDKAFCFDVLDGPNGHDARLRPYQLLAVSLNHSPLLEKQQKAIVDVCARKLLTSYGLRSLASDEPNYVGCYDGGQQKRAATYGQGTVWSWLIGPFVKAHYRVYKDAKLARSFLVPFEEHLSNQGLGNISEVFDGDAPFNPRGCIAHAMGVAEVLTAWQATETDSINRINPSITKSPQKNAHGFTELALHIPSSVPPHTYN